MFGTSKEKRFWKWFQMNEEMLYSFEIDREGVFDLLANEMRRVDPNLTFLFGPQRENGTREFIISADGISASFTAVEALYAAAPTLSRWSWVKFRPRLDPGGHMTLGERKYPADSITYKMYKDEGRVGLVVFMKGLTEDDREFHQHIGFLFLDHLLGEYDVGTRVGFIEFVSAADERAAGASPLADLPGQFDWYFEQRKKELH